MAINPDVAFPGKTAGVSPQYPYGKARDVSAPGDGTGTPLRASWVNDWFGLQQQLLSLAGITPSGVADAVGACQIWDALNTLLSPTPLKNAIGVCSTLAELQAALALKGAFLVESISVPSTGLALPSYAVLEQKNGAIGFIGATYSANKTISKTGNATIALSNQDANAGSATVDAVVYQDPAWPSGSVYPQKTTLRNLGIVGNAANFNQAGIYVLQAGVMTIDAVDVVNCVNGLLAKDMFLSDVRKLHTLGKIRLDNGTSMTFTDCWARGHTSREGAFDFTGLKYSALNGCASDSAPNTAYAFEACQGVVLNGCGCEGAATITPDRGTALAFKNNNTVVVNAFTCVPVAAQGQALITVGDNNKISIHGWDSNFGVNHPTDIYVYGNGSVVEVWESKFYNGREPVIQIAMGSTSSVIVHLADGNVFKYTAPAVAGPAAAEALWDAGVWSPTLSFNSGSTGIAYTVREGTWEKFGQFITFHFRIALSSKGTSTGAAVISGAPGFVSKGDEAVDFALLVSVVGGVLHGTIDKGGTNIVINVRSATGDSGATDANFTNGSLIRGSYRISLAASKFA